MEKIKQYFDWIQLTILVIFSPLFIFPKSQFWWIIFLIPLLWIIRLIIKKQMFVQTPVNIPILFFFIMVLMNMIRIRDFFHALPKFAGIFYAIGLFFVLVGLSDSKRILKWMLAFFFLGGFIFSLIGLLGMPTFKEKHLTILMQIKDKIPRINFGLPGSEMGFAPTVVGGILLLIIPLFFMMILYIFRHRSKFSSNPFYLFLMVMGLLVTGIVLLLTQSRGAWAGLFISTLILGFLFLGSLFKKKKVVFRAISLILAIVLIIGIATYSLGNSNQLNPAVKQAEGTLLFRIQLWDLTIPMIKANPFWGIGLNNFRRVPEVRYFLSHAHNQFLHLAVELGIPTMIAFMAILLGMAYMCIYVWKTVKMYWIKYAIIGLGWGQLAHLFFCLTDAIPPGAKVGLLFWVSFALISGLYLYGIQNMKTKVQS